MIKLRAEELRVVIITGPSSSGKTTTAAKINQRLVEMGMKFTTLNVDNYFYDLDMHPKDEFGDYDFETPQALDLELINEHLRRLLKGEQVLIPSYDFQTGTRVPEQTPMKLTRDEVLLIDSLHGLYPAMTEGVPPEQQFKLYLEPLLQLKDQRNEYVRWTDIRLIRRMLRDAAHRNWPMEHTLTHWHYVRASELRSIIPYIHTADYIINTAMPYELPIYRPKVLDKFVSWELKYEGDALRHDAFMRANRVRKVLEQITAIDDDSIVPADSVIREFIGGSIYDK
jgi:uridine kinase